jgi:hypothetical protein
MKIASDANKSSTLCTAYGVVLATGLGNPPAVWVWTGKMVRFGSKPVQKPDPLCLGGVVTRTGHKPAVFWPGLSYCRASFSRTQILNWSQSLEFAKLWNQPKNRGFGAVRFFDVVKPVATVPVRFQPGPGTEPPIWNHC